MITTRHLPGLTIALLIFCASVPSFGGTLGLGPGQIAISGSYEVTSITLNGRTYQQTDFLLPTLQHIYMSSSSAYDGPHGASPRSALLEDLFVNTGADNLGSGPGGRTSPPNTTTPGMLMSFSGLTNGPGYDVVFVDRYSTDAFIVYTGPDPGAPAELDVPTTAYGPQMLDMTYGKNPFSSTPTSLTQFNTNPSYSYTHYVHSYVHGVALDLSDLGVPDGASVTHLFFQDDGRVSGTLDPVFVTGLIPEPATVSLLALGGLALLRRQERGGNPRGVKIWHI